MAQVTGRVFIKLNGQVQPSKEGAKLMYAPGNIEREPVTSDRGVEGFKEKIVAPTVEATFTHSAALDIDAIHNAKDTTLTYQTDTGVSYILRGAFSTSAPTLATGEVSFKFSAISAEVA
jgi:hypothetical protein